MHSSSVAVEVAVAYVLHDGACKEVGVLKHHAEAAAQVLLLYLVDIDAPVVAYLAVVYVVETVNQVRNGGLACAGSADKRLSSDRLSPHAYVVQHHLVGVVAEVDVVKHDFAAELLVGDGAVGLVRVFPGQTLVRSSVS